mgnify:CR=1 FL=1
MRLEVLEEKTYLDFALKNEYISIYQLPAWGKLKEATGWKYHLLGVYDNDKLIGVTMLLEKTMPLKLSLFYSPRGYLLDVNDLSLLKSFHEQVVKYVKHNHGFLLKVDPNICLNTRDSNGNIITEDGKTVLDNFKKIGFKHLGLTQNFETLQPRFLCRFKLKETYNDTLNSFSKSVKKNITKSKDMGVRVKKVDEKEIEVFTKLLRETGKVKNFIVRPASYYKKMYLLLKDYITLYITYIDTSLYHEYVYNSLENAKKEFSDLKIQMKKINIGEKIKRHYQELENKISKLTKEIEEAKSLKKTNNEIYIGALMSVFIGDEGITFMSGTNALYKEFNPKYAYYNAHIIDSLDKGLKYVNFYGISGNLDKDNPYYGIYEVKKGFNPEIIELIGEFDYVINPFVYFSYKQALKAYKFLKKFKK